MTDIGQGSQIKAVIAGDMTRPALDQERIDRYLANRLNSEERELIETRIVDDPEFRREVELTEAMRNGMRELAMQGEIAPLLAPQISFWSRPPVAVAASIVAGLLIINSFLLYERLDQTRPELTAATDRQPAFELATPTGTETLVFEHTRSGSDGPDVVWHRSATPSELALRFDVGLEPAPGYALQIERIEPNNETTVLSVPHVPLGADGMVTVILNSALLVPGDFQLQLQAPPGPLSSSHTLIYSLRVTD